MDVWRFTICPNVERNGIDGDPGCPNESWHPMESSLTTV
jgi:hypothetical protein